jgi:hypothetical protein
MYVNPKTDIELISRTEQITEQYKSLESQLKKVICHYRLFVDNQ